MNARVVAPDPGRLINRLCKHFRHKIEVEWNETEGILTFTIGQCRLKAADGELRMACESSDDEQLEQLGEVVASHLIRFAGEDVSDVQWRAGS
jgi:hypothetical protein